jgi:hypothetical protein
MDENGDESMNCSVVIGEMRECCNVCSAIIRLVVLGFKMR